jgi:hypothetical protein
VGPEEPRVQINAGNPLADQSGVLSRRYRLIPPATAAEEEFAGPFFCGPLISGATLISVGWTTPSGRCVVTPA